MQKNTLGSWMTCESFSGFFWTHANKIYSYKNIIATYSRKKLDELYTSFFLYNFADFDTRSCPKSVHKQHNPGTLLYGKGLWCTSQTAFLT